MPGFLLHAGVQAKCPHGGQVKINPSNSKVLVAGQPVVTSADAAQIAGCSFIVPPNKPQPCIEVKWIAAATKVTVNGKAVLLQDSQGLCKSAEGIPQGPPIVPPCQTRVKGT